MPESAGDWVAVVSSITAACGTAAATFFTMHFKLKARAKTQTIRSDASVELAKLASESSSRDQLFSMMRDSIVRLEAEVKALRDLLDARNKEWDVERDDLNRKNLIMERRRGLSDLREARLITALQDAKLSIPRLPTLRDLDRDIADLEEKSNQTP